MARLKFQQWKQEVEDLDIETIIQNYKKGMLAALPSTQKQIEELNETIITNGGILLAKDAGHAFNWAESGAGQLITPYELIERVYPGALPGPAQARGDCVSHSGKNARLLTWICEIISRKPDEVTGKIEIAPPLSALAIKNGVLSTEAAYWFRGHGGDGWQCNEDATVALKYAGVVLRQAYESIGIDLTKYSGSLAGKYGRSKPPSEIIDTLDNNLIRTATRVESFEEARDLLFNGYGITTCGGEGWSDKRDENGFSRQQGSWSHALALIGADDRAEIIKLYREPLVLVLNSWGIWNGGPRRIYGTQKDIPNGSFWAKWSDVKRRQMIAFSSVNGWPQRDLPLFEVPGVFV